MNALPFIKAAGIFLAAALLNLPAAFPAAAAMAETAGAPARIVSIGGGTTEILYALGVEDRIAAVDTTSLYPAAATAKPNVGYLRALSAEGVLALSPDLILMEHGAGPPEAVALLDQAGIPITHLPAGYTAGELVEKIRIVSRAVGREAAGTRMAHDAEEAFAALERDLRGIAAKRVLFILSMVDDRPLAAGADTGADAIIGLAGARNALHGTHGYKTISPEAVVSLAPDAILMVDRHGASGVPGEVLSRPFLAATPAGREGALIRMDALYLLGFGPRMPQAVRELAGKLYPALGAGKDR